MHRFACLTFVALFVSACATSTPMPDPPNYGAPCATPGDCRGGATCATGAGPTGFCTSPCTVGMPAACSTSGHCTGWFGTPLCLPTCTTDAECGASFQCWQGTCVGLCGADAQCAPAGTCGADMHCTGPECLTAADCGSGRACSGGRCVDMLPDGGVGMGAEGDPCTASTQCGVGLVCLPASLGGTCARECVDRNGCMSADLTCAPAAIDREGDGTPDFTTTVCIVDDPSLHRNAQPCTSAAECESHLCLDGQCRELCVDDTPCLAGQHCVSGVTLPGAPPQPFRACGYTVATGVDTIDVPLGTFSVSRSTESPPVTVAVDPTAVSISFIAQQTTGSPQTVAFLDAYDPASTHLYSISDIESYTDPPLRWIPSGTEGIGTMISPNTTTDRITFLTGRYNVSFGLITDPGVTTASDVSLTARIKRSAGPLTSGTLDVDVWTIATGLTATSAPTDSFLQNAIAEMRSLYTELGITLGTIRYVGVSAADFTNYHLISSVDGPTSELSHMFELGAGRTDNTLDLFVVDRIEVSSAEGLVTLGIAGGIPGPPGIHGTPHSGVAVIYDHSVIGGGLGGATRLGQVMAHECGHYLGFFHTTEGGRACSPGEIPSATDMCAPFGGGDVLADTAYGDTSNVMYWTAMGGRTLTAGQRFVALRNPLVR